MFTQNSFQRCEQQRSTYRFYIKKSLHPQAITSRYLRLIDLIILTIYPLSVYAASPREWGELRLKTRQKEYQTQRIQTPSLALIKGKQTPTIVTNQKDFFVHSIYLHGSSVLSKREKHRLFRAYLDRIVSSKDIQSLLQQITDLHHSQGYIMDRILLEDPQDLSHGLLQIRVYEYTLEGIAIQDGSMLTDKQILAAFPIQSGDHLNLYTLAQGLSNLNRLFSNNTRMTIVSGNQSHFKKVILSNQQHDLSRATLIYDKQGQKDTGEQRAGMTLEHDNLLGLNDTWYVNHTNAKAANAYSWQLGVPMGYWDLTYSGSYSDYHIFPTTSLKNFGTSKSHTIKARRVLRRRDRGITGASMSLGIKESISELNDIPLFNRDLTILRIGLDQTYQSKYGQLRWDATYVKGIDALGSEKNTSDIGSDEPHAQFEKFETSLSYYQPFRLFSFQSSIQAQWAYDPLFSTERMSLGSQSTVRGYSEWIASGDSGFYIRNQLTGTLSGLHKNKRLKQLRPYVFADVGKTYDLTDKSNYKLSGVGLGLRYDGPALTWDISYAKPWEQTINVSKNSEELYVSVRFKIW